jgi:hypothetical protein
MEGAIIYRWSRSVPGREAAAAAVMQEATEVMAGMQAAGKIQDFAWYIGGQGGPHFAVVRGPAEQLMMLSGEDAIRSINMKAGLVNDDFTWGFYATGDAALAQVAFFNEVAKGM